MSLPHKWQSGKGKNKSDGKREERQGLVLAIPHLVFGLGTTGHRAVEFIVDAHPRYAEWVVTVDGEGETDRSGQPPFKLSTASYSALRQMVANRHLDPVLNQDRFLPTVQFPYDGGVGAGTSRLVGGLKYAAVRAEFRARVTAALHAALKNVEGCAVTNIVLSFVTSSCGGSGSGMLIPAVLDVRDCLRRHAPEAVPFVSVHLLNHTCFEKSVKNPELLGKLAANAEGLYREIEFAQLPPNLEPFCQALNIPAPSCPIFDQVVEYHVTDSKQRSFSLPTDSFERIRRNLMAESDETVVSVMLHRDRCNQAMQVAGKAQGEQRIVASMQAHMATVSPLLFDTFATVWTGHYLDRFVAPASENRVKALVRKGIDQLRLQSNVKNEIHQAFHVIETETAVQTRPVEVARESNANAIRYLRNDHSRFESHVRTSLRAAQEQLLLHYASRKVPEGLERVMTELARSARGVEEVAAVLNEMATQVGDQRRQVEGSLRKLGEEEQEAGRQFTHHQEKLTQEGFFLGGRQRKLTAEASVGYQRAAVKSAFYTAFHDVLGLYEEQLADRARSVRGVVEALRERQAQVKEHGRSLRRTLSADSTSVVAGDEVKTLISKVTTVYKQGTGQDVPALDLQAVLDAGASDLDGVLHAYWEAQRNALHRFFKADIPDLTTFCQKLGLRFSLGQWVEETLSTLARSAPLDLAHVGPAQEKTLLVASGGDGEMVRRTLSRRPDLHDRVEFVPGATGLTVSICRRIDGLPLTVLPARQDAARAAAAYLPPQPGMPAFDVLCSSGHLLGAFTEAQANHRQGLATPPTRRRLVVAKNGVR